MIKLYQTGVISKPIPAKNLVKLLLFVNLAPRVTPTRYYSIKPSFDKTNIQT